MARVFQYGLSFRHRTRAIGARISPFFGLYPVPSGNKVPAARVPLKAVQAAPDVRLIALLGAILILSRQVQPVVGYFGGQRGRFGQRIFYRAIHRKAFAAILVGDGPHRPQDVFGVFLKIFAVDKGIITGRSNHPLILLGDRVQHRIRVFLNHQNIGDRLGARVGKGRVG